MQKYELIVIGSGPAGEKAAVKAAYFYHKVALVERSSSWGGISAEYALTTKTLKETALYFSGKYDRGLYGIDRSVSETSIGQFMSRRNQLIKVSSESVYDNLVHHKVDLYQGTASFVDPHTIEVTQDNNVQRLEADNILIATGSYTFLPPSIPFDGKRIHNEETICAIDRFPKSLCIVGAGAIGCEFATIFSTLGIKVYLINRGSTILPSFDQEIVSHLIKRMKEDGIEFLMEKTVKSIDVPSDPNTLLRIDLDSGEALEVDMFLFCASRKGQTESLHLERAGIQVKENGTIQTDEYYRTNVPNVYAVGDVIGYPSLANVSMDQGRASVSHMFHMEDLKLYASARLPYGIYTIPEVSMVGTTEEEAKKQGISYGIAKAYHEDMVRGIIMGAKHGVLKMVFDKKNQTIIGVHIIGHLASELIHYGVELVQNKQTLNDVIIKSYNYPSLHELYKYAAFDGLSTLAGHKMKISHAEEI